MRTENAVVIDGAGDRYLLVSSLTYYTLRSEKTGTIITIDQFTMQKLGLEIGGQIIREQERVKYERLYGEGL